MIVKKKTVLSFGSNVADRFDYLQRALDLISDKIGNILAVSSIYETPAWGFDGDDFFNGCVQLETKLSPNLLLEALLDIETTLGRVRDQSGTFQSRTIDLDIIFYEDMSLDKEHLKIPHPQFKFRRFVLEPLAEIIPDYIHPQSSLSIRDLLHYCSDKSEITKTSKQLSIKQKRDFSQFNYIAIEGNIGAGKTTLSKRIAEEFNGKLVLEQFADNPFLPQFYKDQQRYAFPLEMSFLAERYQQFCDDTTQLDLFKNFMISDYDIHKSLVFAKITLQEEEFKLYRKIFGFMYKEIIKPDVYVYLYQNSERLQQNIKKRGRDYEQDISTEYLEKINKGYLEYIKTYKKENALIIDISKLDFVENQKDYQFIIDEINNFIVKKQ